MAAESTAAQDLQQALELLEDAARKTPGELNQVAQDKYNNLKKLLADQDIPGHLREWRDAGAERCRVVSEAVDTHVHENPWPYVGGALIGGLLLGVLIGSKS